MSQVQITNGERMQITVDGVSWLPWCEVPTVPSSFHLGVEHIAAAKEMVGGWDALQWALENEATVQEMQAWKRAIHAEKVASAQEPKRPLPLPVPAPKRRTGLFDPD